MGRVSNGSAFYYSFREKQAGLRFRFFNAPFRLWECKLHTLIHTLWFEILLPHIVVILPEFDIQISAIYRKFFRSSKF
jgi:hypothetical protein